MAYKLSFPLDEFKKINSTLSEYYSEYFMKEKVGLIFGSSLNEYAFNIATISEDIMQKLSLDSILLHPNYLRTKINDCKKSMTYVETSEQSFRVYTFDEKIKDTPDMHPSSANAPRVTTVWHPPTVSVCGLTLR